MQIVDLFNLETTALEHFSFSPHTAHEGGMFDVELMEHLQAGDGLLGDRLYGSRAWPKGACGATMSRCNGGGDPQAPARNMSRWKSGKRFRPRSPCAI